MVLIMQSKPALKHLLEHGFVYTVRLRKRKKDETYDWVTDRRGGRKIADVYVCLVGGCGDNPEAWKLNLWAWVDHSGFPTVNDWINEILKLNHGKIGQAWLYLVKLKNPTCAEIRLTLHVEKKELEDELGFTLTEKEWNTSLLDIILDNPEVIPRFIRCWQINYGKEV